MTTPDPAQQKKPKLIRLDETDTLLPKHWLTGSMKYEDFEPLAEGGTAVLEVCLDRNLYRRVVIKRLHPHLRDSEMERRRFLREARVTAKIAHPGTVPVYEIGRDGEGALYFTMKKLDGRDLRSILNDLAAKDRATEAEFPMPILVDVLISACQTVAYAHTEGVIHRDLKPANILAGAFGEVTVLDWGLAKVYGEKPPPGVEPLPAQDAVQVEMKADTGTPMGMTQPGRRYGTPLYMSPEQATADPDLDERSDVYNLGSILYEILTLKNLVYGQSVEEVLEQVLHRPTPRPFDEAPAGRVVPPELEAICLKCLHKDPADRYDDVRSLADDLIAYRGNEDVSVYRYGPMRRLVRWRVRHGLALSAIFTFILGVLVAWLVLRGR